MTIQEWLNWAEQILYESSVATAHLDSLVLLSDQLNKPKAWLLAHPDNSISSVDTKKLEHLIADRAQHIPLAYLRGRTEFYGRNFVINRHVLEPRPESETMIDVLKQLPLAIPKIGQNTRILDIGTGSGALGITAQLELKNCQADLIDIDQHALEVAKINVDLFTLNISVIQNDLITGMANDYTVYLCNLPYVPDDFKINRAAVHEPKLAIYGGPDGLSLYRKLFNQIHNLTKKPLYILSESLPPQHDELAKIASHEGYKQLIEDDFIQAFELEP